MTTNSGTVLVVDDDSFNRILLTTNLEEEGYTVEAAENGRQGLEVLRAQPIDLVLLDLLMPEMDGFEVLKWMKAESTLQHIPVIVISGEEDMESVIRCIEMGAMDYLPKPFDPVLLRTRVKNALLATKRLHDQGQELSGTVLVVDDDTFNRTLLSTSLEEEGYSVEMAENGRQAIEMLHEQPFDAVLLDLLMPEMDGFQVLKLMKADSRLQHIPVIVVSGEEDMESVVRCIEMGAEDYLPKPFDPVLLRARIGACLEKKRLRDQEIKQQQQLNQLNKALEVRNRFIRETFGRYLSDDIVDTILESPEGLSLGGEKRTVTIMMSDLRGFTAIGEQLPAESVVSMINIYLDVMTEIILKYQGTIDEFIGDAILAIFGAPILRDDDAKRAVACALEMQLAMEEVNKRNREAGYPEVEMGIGINTGEVVVGNIGSKKRTKYGVVGRNINLTSRIESYTVGGQIFISESTVEACDPILRIDSQLEVMPKGVKELITIYEVGGIGGDFNIFLPEKENIELTELQQPLTVEFTILAGKHAGVDMHKGTVVRMVNKVADIQTDVMTDKLTDLKLSLFDNEGTEITSDLYAKVIEIFSESPPMFRISFTSVPPEARAFFEKVCRT